MANFKVKIESKLKEVRGSKQKVATLMGITPGTLTKYLEGESKELKSFESLLILVRETFPDNEYELMTEYIKTLIPSKMPARHALEYADSNNLDQLAEHLILKLEESGNLESEEWAKVYKTHRSINKLNMDVLIAAETINKLSINDEDLKKFLKISMLYKYLSKRQFQNMSEALQAINEDSIEVISDSFIRKSYMARMLIIKASSFIGQNNPVEGRKCALRAMEEFVGERFMVFGNLHVGNSYMFENYDLSKKYLLDGLEFANSNENYKCQLIRSLCFLENYWGKDHSYLNYASNEIEDIHEVAFYLIRKNENEKALEILNTINKDTLTSNQAAYHHFYRGLIDNTQESFLESYNNFKDSGDKYFMKIALIELSKLGLSDLIINSLGR